MPIELTEDERKELFQGHVPKERFDEATGKLKDELQRSKEGFIRLEEQVRGLQQNQTQNQNQDEPQATYTRAQLREYVDSGDLTQDQSDELWDKQVDIAHDKKLDSALLKANNHTDEMLSNQNLVDRIGDYIKILPDLKDNDSENKQKVNKEFDSLVSIMGVFPKGSDQDLKIQLSALERAFGPEDKLKEKLKSGSENRQTMESLGGNEGEPSGVPQKGALKGLSSDQKAYYQKGIDQKRYKDWDAVEAELSFERKT